MKFESTRSIENIHLIYNLLIKEPQTAGDVSLEMCCGKPLIYLYFKHMEAQGFIRETGKQNSVSLYKAIMGVNLPPLAEKSDIEAKEKQKEERDKQKLKSKFSKIKPFKDEWLFSLFSVK